MRSCTAGGKKTTATRLVITRRAPALVVLESDTGRRSGKGGGNCVKTFAGLRFDVSR